MLWVSTLQQTCLSLTAVTLIQYPHVQDAACGPANQWPAAPDPQGDSSKCGHCTALQLLVAHQREGTCEILSCPPSFPTVTSHATQVLLLWAKRCLVLKVCLPYMCQLSFTEISSGCSYTDALISRKTLSSSTKAFSFFSQLSSISVWKPVPPIP